MHTQMKGALVSALLVIGSVFYSGCVSKQAWQITRIQEQILKVEVGMTRQQVIDLLGRPDSREVLPDKNGTPLEVLKYQTEYTHTGSPNFFAATEDEMTSFIFIDGHLKWWGRDHHDHDAAPDATVSFLTAVAAGAATGASSTLPVYNNASSQPAVIFPGSQPAPANTVVETSIDGNFNGWSGRTIWRMQNGQVWEQTDNDIYVAVGYGPQVIIVVTGYQTGVMVVDGHRVSVRQLK